MKLFLCEYIHPMARKALKEEFEIISDWERFPECEAVKYADFVVLGMA